MVVVYVTVPPRVAGDDNITLMLNLEKRTVKEFQFHDVITNSGKAVDANQTRWSKNISNCEGYDFQKLALERDLSADDVKKINLDLMPGFRFTWTYDKQLEQHQNLLIMQKPL